VVKARVVRRNANGENEEINLWEGANLCDSLGRLSREGWIRGALGINIIHECILLGKIGGQISGQDRWMLHPEKGLIGLGRFTVVQPGVKSILHIRSLSEPQIKPCLYNIYIPE
jgi:hypothetical protein